jgi:hypothetical protein
MTCLAVSGLFDTTIVCKNCTKLLSDVVNLSEASTA